MREQVQAFMESLQDEICGALEKIDTVGCFHEDLWNRDEGGGGRSRVINGKHIEKGGVNFSAVNGPLPEKIKNALGIPALEFYATGVSIVLHPLNPWVPIIHMNVRYFETDSGHSWFGGGIDVTPHYINPAEAKAFHLRLKKVCDKHNSSYYPKFKKWADDYFYIKHREETRGIGGIFFDRLTQTKEIDMDQRFEFTKDIGLSFIPVYQDLIMNNLNTPFTDNEKEWQLHRRGRYVEFNLVWDKGTKFGLDTGGRTESILMSMPPMAKWTYSYDIKKSSQEADSQTLLKKEIDWINYIAK